MREDVIARGQNPEDFPILSSKPELYADLAWVWEGFLTLSSHRQYGFNGPQPISLSEVLAFMLFRGIDDPEDQDEFLTLVQALDQVFMADSIAKSKAKDPPKTKP